MSNIIIPRGTHAYDVEVGAATRQVPLLTVGRLRELYPADFEAAALALEPDEWRLLYQVHHFSIFELADPSFDPVQKIWEVLEHQQTVEGIRTEEVGSSRPNDTIIASLRFHLHNLTADELKALWCILVAAKQSDMDADEVRQNHWWSRWRDL